MTGNFIDSTRYFFKKPPTIFEERMFYLDTDFGKIRGIDTGGNKPVLINVPDGPNVIEHQKPLIEALSINFRVVCFEYPGLGFSYPNFSYDYSFKSGSELLLQVMDILKVQTAVLLFSCSNGFYAMKAAESEPGRFSHIFLSQTPSVHAMTDWTKKSIPPVLKVPVAGQLINAFMAKKLAQKWYKYSLPRNHTEIKNFRKTALASLKKGGCFCLSGLVQGLKKDADRSLEVRHVPATLVWGRKDFTHRHTDHNSIFNHIKTCEIIEFENCGHFPELEDTSSFTKLIKERIE